MTPWNLEFFHLDLGFSENPLCLSVIIVFWPLHVDLYLGLFILSFKFLFHLQILCCIISLERSAEVKTQSPNVFTLPEIW